MGFFDAFLLVGLFLVGVPLAGAFAWVMRRVFHLHRFTWVPMALVLGTIVAGAPIALRVAGERTDARVVARDDRVMVDTRDGSWLSIPALRVRYRPREAWRADPVSRSFSRDSVDASVHLDPAAFDRTPVGAIVPVTYVAFRPSIVKLSDRTLAAFWREVLAVGGVARALAVAGAILCALLLWRWSPTAPASRAVRRGALGLAIGVAAVAGTRAALVSAAHGPDGPFPAATTARVEGITTIGTCGRCGPRRYSQDLAQPFQVVTLAFTPLGAPFPVHTADAVDSGSVRGLAERAVVPVHYAPDRPRAARLDGATRTFEVRNGRDTLLLTSASWVVILVLCVAWSVAWPGLRARVQDRMRARQR